VITRHLLGQAGLNADKAGSGAVTLVQRFGSAATLSIHLHCLLLDGLYRRGAGVRRRPGVNRRCAAGGVAQDHHSDDEAAHPSGCWSKRRVRPTWPTTTATPMRHACSGRCRRWPDLAGRTWPVARPLTRHKQSTGLFVSGLGLPNRFRPVGWPRGDDAAGCNSRDADFRQALCADIDGFSLHAAVRCAGATPAAAPDSVWCPRNFAAQSERAPAARTRRPGTQRQAGRAGGAARAPAAGAGHTTRRVRGVLRASPPSPVRLGWPKLPKGVFEIHMEHGPTCGGELNSSATVSTPHAISLSAMALRSSVMAPNARTRSCVASRRCHPVARSSNVDRRRVGKHHTFISHAQRHRLLQDGQGTAAPWESSNSTQSHERDAHHCAHDCRRRSPRHWLTSGRS
jgi:hypothetical protein